MQNYNLDFKVGDRGIGIKYPTYFIADIAANHDGSLERAKSLIWQAKDAGADCAKFQHFLADQIVSSVGFDFIGDKLSHQAGWKKSVVEVYDQYHTKREWTQELLDTCKAAEIEFMTTPYDFKAIEQFSAILPAIKIGSGDITFHPALEKASESGKPIFLATGASDISEVKAAVDLILKNNPNVCLMQCNTNYTGSKDNFRYVNLRVLQSFALCWPGLPLGFSDHTPGHSAVLGAVALGARAIEKHFTDDNAREGPDHAFALNPDTWRAMVDATRDLEDALGDGVKRVESNEKETVIVQRRALRAKVDLSAGRIIQEHDLTSLRPCSPGDCSPKDLADVLGRILYKDIKRGDAIRWKILC